ncbi:hypothetical protein HPB49_003218 [Dermacentor silvarum]|uniref:Uncharacterized protein n=1 Tax=Dermacentor silvarum TaxID=543639 RepID=A0ACB8D2M0_DERSI|nr:hypothetical protein HPB49_003218 [Dermacentor silvarum]
MLRARFQIFSLPQSCELRGEEESHGSQLLLSHSGAFFRGRMVTRTKKVFVGGLSAPTTLEDVKNYFQQFGRLSRCPFIAVASSVPPPGNGIRQFRFPGAVTFHGTKADETQYALVYGAYAAHLQERSFVRGFECPSLCELSILRCFSRYHRAKKTPAKERSEESVKTADTLCRLGE